MMTNLLKKLVHEPLLHFLLLGAVIFVGSSLVSRHSSDRGGEDCRHARPTRFHVGELRPASGNGRPHREEWEGLIRERVREEVYYREALAMGLDKDDIIIRRRLQQKMEFVSDDVAARVQPTDDELRRFLQAHPDLFRVDQRFTFRQVFLSPEKRGKNLARDAAQLLARVEPGRRQSRYLGAWRCDHARSHSSTRSPPVRSRSNSATSSRTALGGLSLGQWQGPVESGYGVHLVFVSERLEGRLPALAEVRDAVRREWDNANRLEANEKFYQDLLKHYTVTIENPEPPEARNVAGQEVK